ncbi:CDP-alcohol phosphatidyltransferase [Adlercreutzia murintestinalis]|jgi:hypothetical protein|uniref:CDP-alcohol phosphatidyltransferase n=1 Tax=Adlercreutzia murintestinalis TaxID=2941325 RepID=UPI0020408E85|nr:CDP-alcohol phosphatidyltransferase [Adlercreutzia murintestinalis]
MGVKSSEVLEISYDELQPYLHANHAIYMDIDGQCYYLTDVNDRYWRVQDCSQKNDKGHYVDVSELVPTIAEFLELPFLEGKSVRDLFENATFYASEK